MPRYANTRLRVCMPATSAASAAVTDRRSTFTPGPRFPGFESMPANHHRHFRRWRRVPAAAAANDAVDHHHADAGNVAELHAFEQRAAGGVLGAVHEDEVGVAAHFDQAAVEFPDARGGHVRQGSHERVDQGDERGDCRFWPRREMTGLDTNVLVRYVMQDDAKQSTRATESVEALTVEAPGFVPLVAVIEFVSVLSSAYWLDRSQLVAALGACRRTRRYGLEGLCARSKAVRRTFADCVIERSAGCMRTMTFDRGAAKQCGMLLIG